VNDAMPTRPVPHPTALSEPFWQACRRRELVVQQCEACRALAFYPRASCPTCGSLVLVWRPVSGQATLFTVTIARRPTHRRLAGRVPYVIAIVELDEGLHMTSTVVGCDIEALRIGQRLIVDFEDVDEVSVPVFRPVV